MIIPINTRVVVVVVVVEFDNCMDEMYHVELDTKDSTESNTSDS